tara:strand:- start:619 stop:807 length:189 start_codon:yes stop_codon:yes gene_type:complete
MLPELMVKMLYQSYPQEHYRNLSNFKEFCQRQNQVAAAVPAAPSETNEDSFHSLDEPTEDEK